MDVLQLSAETVKITPTIPAKFSPRIKQHTKNN